MSSNEAAWLPTPQANPMQVDAAAIPTTQVQL